MTQDKENCVPGNTVIHTTKGPVRISDLDLPVQLYITVGETSWLRRPNHLVEATSEHKVHTPQGWETLDECLKKQQASTESAGE